MKTFAITFLTYDSQESVSETITVQTETVDLALQNFTRTSNPHSRTGGRIVGIVEIQTSGKNL